MPVITAEKQADLPGCVARPCAPARNCQIGIKRGVSRRGKKAGTALAFKEIDTGSAMPQSDGPVRRGKRSTALTLKQVQNILAAGDNTPRKHRGLNRFTTIHFEAAKVPDPVWAIGRLMKLAGDWLRTRGAELFYIWVRESGDGKGEHVHILWSVRPDLVKEFALLERGWRKKLGAKPKRGAFKSKPVGLSYKHGAHEIQYGQDYETHLAAVLSYIVKGAEPKAVKALGLSRVAIGGEFWGKRCGTSENVGRTARSQGIK